MRSTVKSRYPAAEIKNNKLFNIKGEKNKNSTCPPIALKIQFLYTENNIHTEYSK